MYACDVYVSAGREGVGGGGGGGGGGGAETRLIDQSNKSIRR